MQIKQTITLFGTVSNSATSRTSKNSRKYTAFGVAIIPDRNLQAFHYNVVAFGKQGHFAKPLQKGTRIKLVVQAQSQPDNIATLPLLTATFVRPVHPVEWGESSGRLRHRRQGLALKSFTHEARNEVGEGNYIFSDTRPSVQKDRQLISCFSTTESMVNGPR